MYKFLALLLLPWQVHGNPSYFADVLNVPREEVKTGYRLPNDTTPIHHHTQAEVQSYEENGKKIHKYYGFTSYYYRAIETANSIAIHRSRKVEIDFAGMRRDWNTDDWLQRWDGSDIPYDEEKELLTFVVHLEPPIDFYFLCIYYTGTLDNSEQSHGKWLPAIHRARQHFPSYDEPGISAFYKIFVAHSPELFGISNAAVSSRIEWENGTINTDFDQTPKIPASRTAWALLDENDYSSISNEAKIPQTVYTKRQSIGLVNFALHAGTAILNELDNYLNLVLTFNKKLDLITVPNIFSGGSGSAGLTIYNEIDLFYDPKKDSWADKHNVALNIAHQYVQQFFGNLVSPAWWHYLWLSTGFAHFLSYHILSNAFPEFDDEENYQITMQGVMEHDGYGVTRAMTYYVESPEDIARLHDNIAYSKSGSVLRMWMHALGDSTWRRGLSRFLHNMPAKGATSDDLARELQGAVDADRVDLADLSVAEIVNRWSHTSGYPVVTVSMNEDTSLSFEQNQFLYPATDQSQTVWFLPLSIASAKQSDFSNTKPQYWMKAKGHLATSSRDVEWDAGDWIVVNVKQTGYYRVNYEEKLWDRIIEKLKDDTFQDIHHANRAGLLNDAFNLARADLLPYTTAFTLSEYLHHETHFAPWTSISNEWLYLDRMLDSHKSFQCYIRQLITKLYDKVFSREGYTWSDLHSREITIKWACKSDYSDCREKTRRIVNEEQEIPPDLQKVMYCEGLRHSAEEDFDTVWAKQETEMDEKFRARMLQGLGCNENSVNQKKFLMSMLDEGSTYTGRQGYEIVKSVYSNSQTGMESVIELFLTHSSTVEEKYGHVLTHISNIARLISSEGLRVKFSTLLNELKVREIIENEDEVAFMKIVNSNLNWKENNEEEALEYLKICEQKEEESEEEESEEEESEEGTTEGEETEEDESEEEESQEDESDKSEEVEGSEIPVKDKFPILILLILVCILIVFVTGTFLVLYKKNVLFVGK